MTHNPEKEPSNGDSIFRDFIDATLTKAITGIQDTFPSVTADHITTMGLILTQAGIALENHAQELERAGEEASKIRNGAVLLSVLGVSFDKLDGVWARLAVKKGRPHDSERGAIIDVVSDRIGELLFSLGHIINAHNRDDITGMVTAYINSISHIGPSILRAEAEKKGRHVKEDGRNPIEFLGTRAGRAILLAIALFFPEVSFKYKGKEQTIPLQTILSIISTLSNITTSVSRYEIVTAAEYNGKAVSPEKVKEAERKARWLQPLTIFFAAASTSILGYLNMSDKSEK